MENEFKAAAAGTVKEIRVQPGQAVNPGDVARGDRVAMAPAIEFNGVNKWFGKLHVLRGRRARRWTTGEVIVVCGPSGSGKSTLIRCVNGLEPIQKGDILVLRRARSRRRGVEPRRRCAPRWAWCSSPSTSSRT